MSRNIERISKDDYYLGIALAVSQRSTCLRRRYGCVIVNNDIIVATGYNGSARGDKNCTDIGVCKRANEKRYEGYEKCAAVHAEQNALIATNRATLIGATAYLASYEIDNCGEAHSVFALSENYDPVPCSICMNMLKNAGIARIVNRQGDIYVLDSNS